jgi:hypothetical protein
VTKIWSWWGDGPKRTVWRNADGSVEAVVEDVYHGPMTTTTRSNRYAGECDNCGDHVPAGTGRLKGRHLGTGRWLVAHLDCADAPAPVPTRFPRAANTRAARWAAAQRATPVARPPIATQVTREPDLDRGTTQPDIYREACRLFRLEGGDKYIRYIDRLTDWGDVHEMMMHAMEAWMDAQDGGSWSDDRG